MALDDAAVTEIQRLYADTNVTVVRIGEQFGISPSAVCRLARTRAWTMRWKLMGRSPRRGQPSTPKARAVLAHRLCDAITKKLDQMEKGMESGDLSSSDYERDAKSVGSMISGMEKVAAVSSDGDKERKPKAAEAAVTYTAAQQVADFGSPQPAYSVRVYQLSGTDSRGTPRAAVV